MKLKKIASLALAGIMAVSMLAGCKDGGNTNDDPVPETPVSNAVTYANDVLSGAQKAVFEFEGNADFDAAVRAVVTDGTKFSSAMIDQYDTIYYAANRMTALETEIGDELDGDVVTSLSTVSESGTKKQVFAYVVSGNLEEKAAVDMMVSAFANLINRTNFPATYGNTYNLDYTSNVSALKVSSPDDSSKSVWVLSVVVSQTATEAANA